MKLIAILATVTLSSMVTAAPVGNKRDLIPKPMDLLEMMYPHSGIPKLTMKVEKELNLCMLRSIKNLRTFANRGCKQK
ncbi:hypothetical protein N7481_001222 [Penicillium waksmanii]|uniref:uncharacterized protein n=1 Tax=Penicillium waksmanii TaxID=69791 RepID=UPI0025473046|nr:uncharacterized protein N7481_001222 [Penicillium waksmanii]KAJ6000813.1 hypothetical protein N7481_001222 [Penicillium waksmanii]